MPNGTICQLVKLPVVIGDIVTSVTVDNVTCLDEQAKKIDHIDVVVRDLEGEPIFGGTPPAHANNPENFYPGYHPANCNSPKATFHVGEAVCGPRELKGIRIHGTIHKQIYYVDKHDDVRHLGEDISFTKVIDVRPALIVMNPNNIEIDFRNVDLQVDFDLHKSNRIQQIATISLVIKVVEETQLFISIFPDGCDTATLGIQDSFEDFTGNIPTNWQGENVAPNPNGRTGQAVELGFCPTRPASLVRSVPDVVGGQSYELAFWARSLQKMMNPCAFTLMAQIMYLDASGNPINSVNQTIRSQDLSDTYQPFRISGVAPEGTTSAMLSFVFTPESSNTCAALIDDLTFSPV
ncbi:hypothetical protein [Desulfotomaculum sp. 1211_IL3151]|uniref:hypothetical protein n=1 Tax=Desulfotomaculum sp. 1211_IL3151 TaxID=3084055 RepID=UPI002FDA7A6B